MNQIVSHGRQQNPPPGQVPDVPPFTEADFQGVVLRRAFAYLIDIALIGFFGFLIGFAAMLLGLVSFGLLSLPMATLMLLWPVAYHTFTIGGPHSATPGMRLCGLQVRVWHGGQPGYVQALLHTVVFYASVGLTSGLILILPIFHNRGRCLHDILCGTFVVRSVP